VLTIEGGKNLITIMIQFSSVLLAAFVDVLVQLHKCQLCDQHKNTDLTRCTKLKSKAKERTDKSEKINNNNKSNLILRIADCALCILV